MVPVEKVSNQGIYLGGIKPLHGRIITFFRLITPEIMIEVDPEILLKPEDEDYDSTGYDSSTASLTSSIQEYVFENGRRYHAYYGTDKYLQPTDEAEQDRLDLHHEIQRLVWEDKLHQSPLSEPHRILDIGTGTGIWAIGMLSSSFNRKPTRDSNSLLIVDMADTYPMAEVIGTDLSPIQPTWVPANWYLLLESLL
jgi:hypothetical protein